MRSTTASFTPSTKGGDDDPVTNEEIYQRRMGTRTDHFRNKQKVDGPRSENIYMALGLG